NPTHCQNYVHVGDRSHVYSDAGSFRLLEAGLFGRNGVVARRQIEEVINTVPTGLRGLRQARVYLLDRDRGFRHGTSGLVGHHSADRTAILSETETGQKQHRYKESELIGHRSPLSFGPAFSRKELRWLGPQARI